MGLQGAPPTFTAGSDHALLMANDHGPFMRLLTPRNATIALVLLAVITVAALAELRHVRLDHDFEKFFPTDDPELERYQVFRARFGSDNDHLLVGVVREEGIGDPAFLRRVDILARALGHVRNVRSVTSPTNLTEPIVTPLGVFQRPLLRLNDPDLLAIDLQRASTDPRLQGRLFSTNGRALVIVIDCAPGLSKAKSDALLADVQALIAASGLERTYLAGRVHGQYHYIRMMTTEMVFYLTLSIALLAVFLWFGFRSWWGVVVPIATVGVAVLWQIALMTLLGQPLGILTMLLPTILFVVGMSDVVHILEHYLDEIRAGLPRREAIARTYHHVGLPTMLTAITAGIGFATLGTAAIKPLQEFGWFTGVGVLLTFLIAFTLLPALLLFIPPQKLLPVSMNASPWDHRLPRLFQWTLRHRRAILIGFTLATVGGALGTTRIRVNSYLLDDWPESEKERLGYRFFEEHFSGVRPFELEVTVSEGHSVWDPSVLRAIAQVEQRAAELYGALPLASPALVLRALNQAHHGGRPEHYTLPDDSLTTRRYARRAALVAGDKLATVASEDGLHARISGRMPDRGSAANAAANDSLALFIARHVDTSLVRFRPTGMAHLIDHNNATLSMQLMRGMGLAIVLTALIMMWFFRDPRMVLVALLPNVIPLVLVAGVMGLIGIDLKVGTAIIFSIAFGIAEDDTIHMLAKLRQQLRAGQRPAYALERTYLTTGKAVTVTGLMLLSGFVTLVFSDFGTIRSMGILVTLTLAFAFVAELLLLPVLVMYLLKRDRRQQDGSAVM
jgi:predicted RND superfamily exporter protein